MSYDQKSELEKELGEIRREVIEARNLVIKTDHLLKNLHAEVKSIGKRHEDLQNRQWVSSGVAYALFAALCAAGAVVISAARTSSATAEKERLEKSVTGLTAQLDKDKSEMAAVQAAQRAASEVYRMMTTLPGDERLKGVDALVKLDTARLTPLEKLALNDRAVLLRKEIGESAFERGKTAFRRNDMAGAVSELTRFVAMNPEHAELNEASFFLGISLNALKKHDQAVPYLARFVTEEKRSKNRDYAMLILAHSLEQTNQLDKAAAVARDALATYPGTQFAPQFRVRLGSIRRLQVAAADSTAAQAAPAASPGALPGTPGSPAPAPAAPVAQPAPATPSPSGRKPVAGSPPPPGPAHGSVPPAPPVAGKPGQ